MNTTMMTTITAITETMTTTVATAVVSVTTPSSSDVKSFKDIFLVHMGRDEIQFLGIAGLLIILILIIACCIGCKGCCCRACCGARETRLSSNSYGVHGMGSKPKQVGDGNEVAVVPINRCCYHPQHCLINVERPFVCDCRRVCRTCTGYFPISKPAVEYELISKPTVEYKLVAKPTVEYEHDDIENEHVPVKFKSALAQTSKYDYDQWDETEISQNHPQQHHRVHIDRNYVPKPTGKTFQHQAQVHPAKVKVVAPAAPKYTSPKNQTQTRTTVKPTAPPPPSQKSSANVSLPRGAWSYSNTPSEIKPAQHSSSGNSSYENAQPTSTPQSTETIMPPENEDWG